LPPPFRLQPECLRLDMLGTISIRSVLASTERFRSRDTRTEDSAREALCPQPVKADIRAYTATSGGDPTGHWPVNFAVLHNAAFGGVNHRSTKRSAQCRCPRPRDIKRRAFAEDMCPSPIPCAPWPRRAVVRSRASARGDSPTPEFRPRCLYRHPSRCRRRHRRSP